MDSKIVANLTERDAIKSGYECWFVSIMLVHVNTDACDNYCENSGECRHHLDEVANRRDTCKLISDHNLVDRHELLGGVVRAIA